MLEEVKLVRMDMAINVLKCIVGNLVGVRCPVLLVWNTGDVTGDRFSGDDKGRCISGVDRME